MLVSNPPVEITITIYSLLGHKVKTIDTYLANDIFVSIPWDTKDQYNRRIANGAYFYHVKAEKDGFIVFEDIFKLAKIE